MSVQVGSFLVSGGAATLRLPWRADAVLMWSVLQEDDGYLSHANFAGYTGDTCISIGLADRVGGFQGCTLQLSDQQAFAPFNRSGRHLFTDRVIALQRAPSASIPGDSLAITGWTKCGITLDVTGTSTYRVYYMAFAGATLNAASGTVHLPGDGSDGSVTGLSFDPSGNPSLLVVIFSATDDDNGSLFPSFGFATAPPGVDAEWLVNYNARGGSASVEAGVAGLPLAGWLVTLSSFNADGFTLSQSVAPGPDNDLLYLLLTDAGGSVDVGTFAWPSSGSSVNTGFAPEGVLFASSITGEEDTSGSITLGALGPGNGDVGIAEAALAGVANVDDQRRWTAQSTAAGIALLDYVGNTGTLSGVLTVSGPTATGFDTAGLASGFGFDPRYAAVALSPVASAQRCRRGALPVLGVG